MENRYLNKNPVDWLLEETDPSIRYLTRKEILVDREYHASYDGLHESNEIRTLLKNNTDILGNTKHFDLFYKGAMWYFAEAVERGLDKRTRAVLKTAEFITDRCQTDSGGFTLNWHPPLPVACRTGDMIKYLLRAGLNGEHIVKGIDWIAEHQRHDGGWLHCPLAGICDQLKLILFNRPGGGLKREHNPQVASCIYATIACSMALVEYKQTTGFTGYDRHLWKAADFLLKRSLFKTGMDTTINPGESWNTDFRLLGYPVLSQYDILYGLIFIARAGFFNDSRTGEAFNIIMSKQNNDGSWNLENAQTGMLFGNARRHYMGKKNKWVTLNVLRLLKYAGM